jgi:hypothetical protein
MKMRSTIFRTPFEEHLYFVNMNMNCISRGSYCCTIERWKRWATAVEAIKIAPNYSTDTTLTERHIGYSEDSFFTQIFKDSYTNSI